jgi:hypothetical protein
LLKNPLDQVSKGAARLLGPKDFLNRRRITDHFIGIVDFSYLPWIWLSQLQQKMVRIISLLERTDGESTDEIKRRVKPSCENLLEVLQKNGSARARAENIGCQGT